MKNKLDFNSVKEMIYWLIDNEGVCLNDAYGRRWMFSDFVFYFGDLGENLKPGKIDSMHLYQTGFYYLSR